MCRTRLAGPMFSEPKISKVLMPQGHCIACTKAGAPKAFERRVSSEIAVSCRQTSSALGN